MVKHNLLKKLSLGIASLVLICPLALGSISNSTVANARRRPRTHRVYRHHRRVVRRHRAHRIYRHHRRARRARKHVHRNHRHSYENILEAEGYENNYGYRPTHHHESTARWYKDNGARLYSHNINSSRMFRQGWYDGDKINNSNYANDIKFNKLGCPGLHRQYTSSSQYKHGWIVAVAQGTYSNDDADAYSFKADGSMRKFIRITPRKDWNYSVNAWNGGMSYMNEHPQTNKFDYNFADNDMWIED